MDTLSWSLSYQFKRLLLSDAHFIIILIQTENVRLVNVHLSLILCLSGADLLFLVKCRRGRALTTV
jgi:hypothetical protein